MRSSRSEPWWTVDATSLAQFVRLESCERYLWYRLHPRETRDLLRAWRVTEQPLTILLRAHGARHEHEAVQTLESSGFDVVDLSESGPEEVVEELRAVGAKVLVQPRLRAELDGLEGSGVADVVLVQPDTAGLRLEVQDAKASRKDRPEHRIQIAFYAMLLRRMAEEAGVPISELTGSVWRIPAGPDDEQPSPFDLEPYEESVRLLLDQRGVVRRVAGSPREDTRFHLTYKCDGCVYNALCMREAAETESLALVPFMTLRDRTILEREGVRDVRALARLKELPPDGRGPLRPARGRRGVLERLEAEWPLCANLDLHVQRARQVARAKGDHEVEAKGWIIGAGFGSMPDLDEYPGLVQVFLEGQHDYLRDALYLAAALVVGPQGRAEEVIELADGPPDLEAEGELVVRFVTRLLDDVREVGGEEVTLHVYVYDR
ncbi:MAG: PD-(D/E)XK nuclease family protein, partial [Armatimonadota bacterium]|nr:PD-(D/E)XK nuclease family protein [Armatimonadota bacterium]